MSISRNKQSTEPEGSGQRANNEGEARSGEAPTRGCRGPGARCWALGRILLAGLVLVLAVGNALIFGAMVWAKTSGPDIATRELPGVSNLTVVEDGLWRGAAPSRVGYEALADHGVETVVDLRAEETDLREEAVVEQLGMDLVRIPMRDGQAPTRAEVDAFLGAVEASHGRVFVHCGAGVGRTGTMAAAYLVQEGQASPSSALAMNLAVGPPSLEQLAFVSELGDESFQRPSLGVTAFSRFLDAPRRLASRLGL